MQFEGKLTTIEALRNNLSLSSKSTACKLLRETRVVAKLRSTTDEREVEESFLEKIIKNLTYPVCAHCCANFELLIFFILKLFAILYEERVRESSRNTEKVGKIAAKDVNKFLQKKVHLRKREKFSLSSLPPQFKLLRQLTAAAYFSKN